MIVADNAVEGWVSAEHIEGVPQSGYVRVRRVTRGFGAVIPGTMARVK